MDINNRYGIDGAPDGFCVCCMACVTLEYSGPDCSTPQKYGTESSSRLLVCLLAVERWN